MTKKLGETMDKGYIQGIIALALVLALCYVVVFLDLETYKDLFSYALSTTLGFFFGRETKTST